MVGGELNLTLSRREVWGVNYRTDRLEHFFPGHFELVRWLDVEPIKLSSTWVNNRFNDDVVDKRLNKLYVHYALLQNVEILDLGLVT